MPVMHIKPGRADPVKKPAHYTYGRYEAIDVIEELTAQLVLGKHTLNNFLYQSLSAIGACQHLCGRSLALTTGIAGVTYIDLVGHLCACKLNLLGVDNDNIITAIDVRSVARLVLTTQNLCDLRSKTSQYLVGSVDNVPLLLNGSGVQRDSFVTS